MARSTTEVAADADAVFTILPSLESVETTILGTGGLIEAAPPRATLIQMSTISPELTRSLAKAVAAKRLGFLDAPMSGTSAMVERGDCAIFVAGDRKRAAACQPVFDAIAKKTFYVGEAGMASLAKLATNLLVGLNTAALAEALVLGASGLAPAPLVKIFKERRGRRWSIRGHYGEPSLTSDEVDLLKDFKLMLEEEALECRCR
jgi:3-hydroxyisobutyrate dehydrogenase-like beta-hydroxyacid dehydrogenase